MTHLTEALTYVGLALGVVAATLLGVGMLFALFALVTTFPRHTWLAERARAQKIIKTWLGEQKHEKCWYYPELFVELAKELRVDTRHADWCSTPREEFELGCCKYQDELYGQRCCPAGKVERPKEAETPEGSP